jgi:predicted metal-dependent hydrolase
VRLFRAFLPAAAVPSAELWEIAGRQVRVTVVPSARARRMTLRADPVAGEVRITVPRRSNRAAALDFASAQRGWIVARVAAWPTARPFAPGACVPLEGEDMRIDWDEGRPRRVVVADGILLTGGPLEALPGRLESWLKRRAKDLLTAETNAVAAQAGVSVPKVGVRDQKGRWGSCAPGGAISYSWRLILAPPEVRRSVVAHEVAHRLHMDHSPAFWAEAARLYDGDMAAARRWLKRHGASLHWVGRRG